MLEITNRLIMDKRTLTAGFIVLAVGAAMGLLADQLIPVGVSETLLTREIAITLIIVSVIVNVSGIILIIYAFVLPDPPIHWNNNL